MKTRTFSKESEARNRSQEIIHHLEYTTVPPVMLVLILFLFLI